MAKGRWLALLLVIIGACCYGLVSTVIKGAYAAGWTDLEVTTGQMTMGTVLMWGVLLSQPKAWSNPFHGPWIRLALTGIFGLALSTLLYNISLSEMDASIAIVLMFQFTWITALMESAASRKWPKPRQFLAAAIIMAGTMLSVNVFQADWSRFTLTGVLSGLGSGVTYALYLFMIGRTETPQHPLMKSAIIMTAALPVLYILYPPIGLSWPGAGALALWGLLLGMLGQVVPTLTFNIGIPRIGSSLAATLASIELPVAVLAAYFLLHEAVQAWQWFGILFILAGIVIAEREASRS